MKSTNNVRLPDNVINLRPFAIACDHLRPFGTVCNLSLFSLFPLSNSTVIYHSYHHPEEVLLDHFCLYVHKGGLKPHSFHLYSSFHLYWPKTAFIHLFIHSSSPLSLLSLSISLCNYSFYLNSEM